MSEFLKGFGKTEDKKQVPIALRPYPIEKKAVEARATPRKPRETYKLATEGDLYQIIKDCLEGEVPVEKTTLGNMKKNFARQPFGGNRRGGGGWNSTAYALFEALVKSGKLHIKIGA